VARTGDLSESALLQHITRLPHSRATFKQLVRELGVKGAARGELDEALARLTARGDLIQLRSGHYVLTVASREFTVGRLNMHRDGYGFVIPDRSVEGMSGDLFIPPDETNGAMHGDRVIARIVRFEDNGRADGTVLRVLRRAHATVVGEFLIKRRGCFVKPHDDRIQQWIEIPEGMELPPSRETVDRVGVTPRKLDSVDDLDGLIVNVEVVDFGERGDELVGRVIEVLGHPDDFGIDVEIMIRKHHIPHQFPPDVLKQARGFSPDVPPDEIAAREDFRELPIVTIDGETARDFDDAVHVARLPGGNWELQVHIADVGFYVRHGSAIDREAMLRGTSVYFPDRAVPMLPVELSTELCSLKPGVDRLVLSAILDIDRQGEVVAQRFTGGVIRSAERMTYTNVYKLLEGDETLRKRYAPLVEKFEMMRELALTLNRRRSKRGSIDFDLPEPIIEFDPEGQMTGVIRSPRNIAHRIIEEFMLVANEAVASHLEQLEIPSLYRIHEPPNPQKVMDFEEIASRFGYSFGAGSLQLKRFRNTARQRDGRKTVKQIDVPQEVQIPSRAYQKLIRNLEGQPEERILTYLMLRSLKQARYSEENRGHYALAAATYTHFTSPIRRYPDLIVHRVLQAHLDGRNRLYSEDQLRVMAEDSSAAERRADEAERELVEWKKAKFMESRIGQEFSGLVISTTRFGLFVELEEFFVEGLVPIDTLPGDTYRYNEISRKIIGDRSRREFSIGDRIRVLLDRVDPIERKLQLAIVEDVRPRRLRRKQGTRRRE
jgi:ribonuclease R